MSCSMNWTTSSSLDEGRTFGMDPLFSEFGIYSSFGQQYTPVDHKMLMNYKESTSGQILEEGISEANSIGNQSQWKPDFRDDCR